MLTLRIQHLWNAETRVEESMWNAAREASEYDWNQHD